MSSRSTSTVVAKTTRQLPTSQETRLLSTMLHNGVYKPTVMRSTSSQSSLSVSLMSTEASNEGDAAEFHTIWIHVGVGIVALVLLVVIAVLVSLQSDILIFLCCRKFSCGQAFDSSVRVYMFRHTVAHVLHHTVVV